MGAYLWTWTREAWIEEMVTKKLLLVLLAFVPIETFAQWKVGVGCGLLFNDYYYLQAPMMAIRSIQLGKPVFFQNCGENGAYWFSNRQFVIHSNSAQND